MKKIFDTILTMILRLIIHIILKTKYRLLLTLPLDAFLEISNYKIDFDNIDINNMYFDD